MMQKRQAKASGKPNFLRMGSTEVKANTKNNAGVVDFMPKEGGKDKKGKSKSKDAKKEGKRDFSKGKKFRKNNEGGKT